MTSSQHSGSWYIFYIYIYIWYIYTHIYIWQRTDQLCSKARFKIIEESVCNSFSLWITLMRVKGTDTLEKHSYFISLNCEPVSDIYCSLTSMWIRILQRNRTNRSYISRCERREYQWPIIDAKIPRVESLISKFQPQWRILKHQIHGREV